nr:MAG TPA: hypothetical protein [Caudoviricetes sp.]
MYQLSALLQALRYLILDFDILIITHTRRFGAL